MGNLRKILTICILWLAMNFIVYFTFLEIGYVISWLFVVIYIIAISLLVLGLVFSGLIWFVIGNNHSKTYRVKKAIRAMFLWIIFCIIAISLQAKFSRVFAYSPNNGELAEIVEVEVNNTTQYMTVRTKDTNNPVILFLAGGPGGTQLSSTRNFLSDLEDDFTIINWEQPGVGKSYDARSIETLTPEVFVEDAHALTLLIKERFAKEKIYLIGESWGSYLGVLLSKAYPEDYYAFIGTGQMVDFEETEKHCYNLALDLAIARGDEDVVKALTNLGEPPIYGENVTMEIASYLQYLHFEMNRNPSINHQDWDTLDTLFSPEYSVLDSLNFIKGLYFTFSHVFQQLYEVDLRETHTDFEIPIYILHGSHDLNAPVYLVEDYYDSINAPEKELIMFEASGHNPWINEYELFNQEVKRLFVQHNQQ